MLGRHQSGIAADTRSGASTTELIETLADFAAPRSPEVAAGSASTMALADHLITGYEMGPVHLHR